MSTVAEVQALLRPYVDRHDDLALVGRAVMIRPVRHLICGFFVDRTSIKTSLNPFWFVTLLYSPWGTGGFDWTGYDHVRHRNLEDERTPAGLVQAMDAAFAEFTGIRDQCSDFGIGLNVFRKLENFPMYRGLVATAEGDFGLAVEQLSRHVVSEERFAQHQLDFIEKHTRAGGRPRERETRILERINRNLQATKRLLSLLERNDKPGVAALLRESERYRAKLWKIEHLWEPTPFPFEKA